MAHWEVIAGNVGTVYSDTNGFKARQQFYRYRQLSRENYGRVAMEAVTLLRDGEIVQEYLGTLPTEDEDCLGDDTE